MGEFSTPLILKQRKCMDIMQKMKSSVTNNYCLFCRTEITKPDHHCDDLEKAGDIIVGIYFEIENETPDSGNINKLVDLLKKEIMNELKDEILVNQEFAQNIKNKILAYSLVKGK